MSDLTEREQYMLGALRAIARFGKGTEARIILRPYMTEHGIPWKDDEDVKTWMQRIAQDAIDRASKP